MYEKEQRREDARFAAQQDLAKAEMQNRREAQNLDQIYRIQNNAREQSNLDREHIYKNKALDMEFKLKDADQKRGYELQLLKDKDSTGKIQREEAESKRKTKREERADQRAEEYLKLRQDDSVLRRSKPATIKSGSGKTFSNEQIVEASDIALGEIASGREGINNAKIYFNHLKNNNYSSGAMQSVLDEMYKEASKYPSHARTGYDEVVAYVKQLQQAG